MNSEDIDKENIESDLLHLASQDKVELTFDKGDMKAKLTPSGVQQALDIIGGQDVADMAAALTNMLIKHGNAFGDKLSQEDFTAVWLNMIQVARVWRYFSGYQWKSVVEKVTKEFGSKRNK